MHQWTKWHDHVFRALSLRLNVYPWARFPTLLSWLDQTSADSVFLQPALNEIHKYSFQHRSSGHRTCGPALAPLWDRLQHPCKISCAKVVNSILSACPQLYIIKMHMVLKSALHPISLKKRDATIHFCWKSVVDLKLSQLITERVDNKCIKIKGHRLLVNSRALGEVEAERLPYTPL